MFVIGFFEKSKEGYDKHHEYVIVAVPHAPSRQPAHILLELTPTSFTAKLFDLASLLSEQRSPLSHAIPRTQTHVPVNCRYAEGHVTVWRQSYSKQGDQALD